jgi:hypothetical protein
LAQETCDPDRTGRNRSASAGAARPLRLPIPQGRVRFPRRALRSAGGEDPPGRKRKVIGAQGAGGVEATTRAETSRAGGWPIDDQARAERHKVPLQTARRTGDPPANRTMTGMPKPYRRVAGCRLRPSRRRGDPDLGRRRLLRMALRRSVNRTQLRQGSPRRS